MLIYEPTRPMEESCVRFFDDSNRNCYVSPSGSKLESSLEALICRDVVARCCELALNNGVNIAVRKTDKRESRVVARQGELERLLAVSQDRSRLPVVRREKVRSDAHVCAGIE